MARPRPTQTARSFAAWTVTYGIARRMILRGARKGDVMARLEVEPALLEDPFGTYEQIRARGRLVDDGMLPVTVDHALTTAILRSKDFGVAGPGAQVPGLMGKILESTFDPWAVGPVDPPSMLAVDPPDHTRYRRLVSRAFTARTVEALEPMMQRTADRLLDRITAQGSDRFDVVEQYAARLPVAVIAEILGVPEEFHDQLLEWGNGAAKTLDPALTWREYSTSRADVRQMHRWFADHIAAIRRDPGDNLLSKLALLEGEEQLSDVELRSTGLLLLAAGFETTVNLIGNAVRVLDDHRDQRDLLVAEPERWGTAVDEVLRFDSPVQLTARLAHVDTEVEGIAVRRGQPILSYLGGANRDPAVFADPQAFDVTRENAHQHLGFSSGIHYCLGAGLARLEGTVALRTLYDRYPDLSVAGPPRRRDTRVLRGYDRLPVALSSRSSAAASHG